MTLEGRGAVVTGGGRGIGAAIARELAEAGCAVLVAARSRAEIDAVAGELVAAGHRAYAIPCDVVDEASVGALAAEAVRLLGAVDILVNNAGIATSAPVKALERADWDRVHAVNATGTFLCTRAFLPAMAARGWGRVVNVASVAGLAAGPYLAAYAAAKHAVIGFTRAAAAEVASKGVTVNAVCPGYVDTPMTGQTVERVTEKTGLTAEAARAALAETSPQHRLFAPEEVAYLVRVLADPRAGGVNGQTIVLDGGQLMH